MRHFLLSTITAITLVTGLTCAFATPDASASAAAPRGGRQILVDGSHETRDGKCGDGVDDGGTTGAQDDGEGTSTTG